MKGYYIDLGTLSMEVEEGLSQSELYEKAKETLKLAIEQNAIDIVNIDDVD